jgi:hypothetical protein
VNRIGAGWLASVTALLLLSALLSAQYVIWLAPAAGIAWAQGEKRLALLTAAAIVLTQLLWSYYGAVLASAPPALILVVVRNVVLAVIAVSAIARLASPQTDV